MPVVLCDEPGGTYWQHWRAFVEAELLDKGMVDPGDMNLFYITDRAEDAVDHILKFYRRYHSSRFVGDDLVLRLTRPLSDQTLAEINDAFTDIITGGEFKQVEGPLEAENGACPDKTRLVFAFDRRSAGRLRCLIDRINQAPES